MTEWQATKNPLCESGSCAVEAATTGNEMSEASIAETVLAGEVLTLAEISRLGELEAVVETGLTVFVKVGNALLEIRDSRLYRQQFPTFEAYCKERWGLKQSRAYQLLDAAVVVGNLQSSTIVELPKTESQARPLTRLEPEVQREVMRPGRY
jgi:hypothetical protein